MVLVSAYADVPLVARAMAGGAVAFIEKPYRNDDLTNAVRQALGRSSQARQPDAAPARQRRPHGPISEKLASFLELRREAEPGADRPSARSTEMISLRGKLLTAAPTQLDPNFFKAVVLVVQHNDRGAYGLILNYPTSRPGRLEWRGFAGAMLPAGQALLGRSGHRPADGRPHQRRLGRTGNLARHLLFGKTEEGGQTPVRPDPAVQVLRRLCRLGPAATGLRSGAGHLGVRSGAPSKFSRTAAVSGSGFPGQASRLRLQLIFHVKHVPASPLLN